MYKKTLEISFKILTKLNGRKWLEMRYMIYRHAQGSVSTPDFLVSQFASFRSIYPCVDLIKRLLLYNVLKHDIEQ